MVSIHSADECPITATEPSTWVMRAHIRAYRALNERIFNCGMYAFGKLSRPCERVGLYLRRLAPIDYTIATCKRALNKTCRLVNVSEPFDREELKTNNQREKKREIRQMRLEMGEASAYSRFAKDAANFAYAFFPKIICQQMAVIPSLAEKSFLYQLSMHYRYINYQIDRRSDYRNIALESGLCKTAERWYRFATTNLIHPLLSKENVASILNIEYLLLKMCQKLQPKKEERPGRKMSDVVVASLARSIQRLKQCDADLSHRNFESKNDRFIAMLGWYSEFACQPPGVPDPRKVGLDDGNLEAELEKALYTYLDSISTAILDEIVPKKFKNPFVHFIYWLEGKNALTKLFSFLIGELGVKQVSDPHQFALAILSGLGIEIGDFEIEGFGRGQMDTIFKAGEKIIKRSLDRESYASSIAVDDFLKTNLRCCPKSCEGIEQKKEARQRLERELCNLLYDAIKPKEYRYEGTTKEVRKMVQQLPVLGSATILLNTLCSSVYFSFSYYFARKKPEGETLPAHVVRQIWGKAYTQTLIEKTMELLYHPAWRFIALQLLHDVTNHLFNKVEEVHQLEKAPSTNDNIRTIAAFILQHYLPSSYFSTLPDYLSDEIIGSLRNTFSPPDGKPFPETVLESILPLINETRLYHRLGESFRKEAVFFEGDAKFWELFVREYLNRAMLSAAKAGTPQELLAAARDGLVKKLLLLEKDALRREFLAIPKFDPIVRLEEPVTKESLINDYRVEKGKEEEKEEELPLPGRFGSEPDFEIVPESPSIDVKDEMAVTPAPSVQKPEKKKEFQQILCNSLMHIKEDYMK